MNDYILRITANDLDLLAFVATTKETVGQAAKIQQTAPVATAALGRLLTAAAIMGATLKNESDILTLNIKGDGPLGGIVATADSRCRVKGYVVNNTGSKLDVAKAIGQGTLNVIKDMGLKEPYIGRIPFVSGEIAEVLMRYYSESEQIPTAIGLGSTGGFFMQLMPGAKENTISHFEQMLAKSSSATAFLEQTPYDIAEFMFKDLGYAIKDKIPVEYYCDCSRERVEKALISLGKKEIGKILAEDKKASLNCHFCGNDYEFDENSLELILKTM